MNPKKKHGRAPGASHATAPPAERTIDIQPLSIRADVGAFDDASRTVSIVFSTGAPVTRYDWSSGTRYTEVLSMDPQHVRMDRLNSVGNLLDSHSAYSVGDVLGAIEPGTAQIADGQGTADIRFSQRDAVTPVWQDVRDKILRSFSVGYSVYKYVEEVGPAGSLPVRTAVDWEPYEVSLVPMPADIGATTRGGKSTTNQCVIVTRNAGAGDSTMKQVKKADQSQREQSETLIERDPLDPGAPLATQQESEGADGEPNERDAGVDYERGRVQAILNACRSARLPQAYADDLIESGVKLVEAQSRVLDEVGRRDMATSGPRMGSGPSHQISVGDDPLVHVRAGIENALLHRVSPNWFKLEDNGRQYRGMTQLDTARLYLQARGIRTTGMTKMELAGTALGLNTRGGLHTTSDFANLLADVANKTLRRAYDEAPQTFTAIARQSTIPDFKMAKRLQIGEAPALLAVDEHGEFTRGTLGEGKEQYQLATYGRVFGISRKALVNDDTDAFARVPMLFGRSARNLESNLVWQQILSNPNMADSVALFHATHANLAGSGAVISVASIGAGRASMRKQTGIDATTLINVNPVFLIVPPSLETVADQFISSNMLANSTSAINPFAGRLTVISEPRLEVGIGASAGSAIAWYLSADPNQIDVVEYAYLEGENGPTVESRIGFDVDGLEIKCRHDFGAKVIDFRGLFKNPGA